MAKKTKCAHGRPSQLPDKQTKFLSGFWSSWDDARADNDRAIISSFYNDMATQFLQKFGVPTSRPIEEGPAEPGTSTASNGEPVNVDQTFDINALNPALWNIGPNNMRVLHTQVTFPACPSNTQAHPTSSTSADSSVPPSQPSKNDWGRTRSVSLHVQSNYPIFLLI